MTTHFNPDADGVLGLQWPVTAESAYAVDSPTKAAGAAVLSHGAETIDKASMYAAAVAGSAGYCMEVWPLTTVTESPDVATSTFDPNEDVIVTNLKISGGATATTSNARQEIDDGATLDLTNYLSAEAGATATWKGRINVGSGNLAGKQILSLTLLFEAQRITSGGSASAAFYALLNIGGTDYLSPNLLVRETEQELSYTWDYNPSTNLPWTIADLELFDVSDEVGFQTFGDGTTPTRVFRVRAPVEHVPEQRLAVGKATIAAVGWQEFNLSTPTGGTTWSKADATEYLFTVRRLYGTGSASFRYLDSLADAPNGHHGYAVQFSGVEGRFLELGAEYTRGHSLIITTSAPATSDDSQPYVLRSLAAVYTGHTVEQELLGVAANYGVVKFVVAAQNGVPSADLLIKLKRRSDNVQHGTTMTVAPEELTGTPTSLREFTVMMAPAALTAVQEYVEFSSTAVNGEGWVVVALDTTGTGSTATFGSTTQAATIGGVEDTDIDIAVIVAQIPTAPAGLAVTVETLDIGHEYQRLTWNTTSLGANFARYELQRDDGDEYGVYGTWQTIAAPTLETVDEFNDHEARRGREAFYRIRVVHTNGIASDWA